jgi:transcriptional regulator with XRE-family HTH domain
LNPHSDNIRKLIPICKDYFSDNAIVEICDPDDMDWKARLRRAFEDSGMKIADLSRASGVPYDSVRKYLSGQVEKPRGDTLDKLAAALGMTGLYLREGIEASANSRFATDEEMKAACYRAAHRTLSALQKKPFDYNLSDRSIQGMALTIANRFMQDDDACESDLESMTSELLRDQEIKKLEG